MSNKTIIQFILLLFLVGVCKAQSNKSENSKENLKTQLLKIEEIRLTDYNQFKQLLSNISVHVKDMSVSEKCHFQYLKLYQLAYQGDNKEALTGLDALSYHCDKSQVYSRIKALMANILVISRDYQAAAESLELAINHDKDNQDTATKIMVYSGASNVYNSLGQRVLSEQYSQYTYELMKTDDNLCKANHFKLLRLINTEINRKQESLFNNTLKVCERSNNIIFLTLTKLYYFDFIISNFSNNEDEVTVLINELNEAEIETNNTGYKNISALYYAIKSKMYLLIKQYKLAEKDALKSLKYNETLGNTEQYVMSLEVLAKIKYEYGEFKNAYHYLDQKNEAEKVILDDKKSKLISYLMVKHNNLAKEYEIKQLNQKNNVLALEKKLAQQEANNQKLVIVLVFTVLVLLIFWSFKIKRKHDYFKDVSEIDHLTKVYTRKAVEEKVAKILSKSKHNQTPVHVSIMDLDLFKRVNDEHGHLVGDWVLKNVLYSIKPLVENGIIIGRLGGEEFGIIMHGFEYEFVLNKIEKMRKAIESLDTSDSGVELKITASFGVTNNNKSGYEFSKLLADADQALFEAKNKGRNQVVVYSIEETS